MLAKDALLEINCARSFWCTPPRLLDLPIKKSNVTNVSLANLVEEVDLKLHEMRQLESIQTFVC